MVETASRKTKYRLDQAQHLAASIIAELSPGCDRIEVAGSTRRKKPEVGDLEIVAIPKRAKDLFGQDAGSMLDPILEALQEAGRFERIKSGEKYKQFMIVRAGVCLDLFLVTPATWGLQMALRTGPVEFSMRLVRQRSRGGFLPEDWHVDGATLWNEYGTMVQAPEERDVFEAIGLGWIEPWDRQ